MHVFDANSSYFDESIMGLSYFQFSKKWDLVQLYFFLSFLQQSIALLM